MREIEKKFCEACGVQFETKLSFQIYCKYPICKKRRSLIASQLARAKYPERDIIYRRKQRYNITQEEYAKLVNQCEGKCQICGITPDERNLVIDHDHDTGKIRGLLCRVCNLVLGRIEPRVINILEYLKVKFEKI